MFRVYNQKPSAWQFHVRSECHWEFQSNPAHNGDGVVVIHRDEGVFLLVLDACGHGMKAAEVVANVIDRYVPTVLGNGCSNDPAELLKSLHSLLIGGKQPFSEDRTWELTATCIWLENGSHDAPPSWRVANAGCPHGWQKVGDVWSDADLGAGAWLGAFHFDDPTRPSTKSMGRFPNGLLIGTDGLSDAHDNNGQPLKREWITDWLNRTKAHGPQCLDSLFEDLKSQAPANQWAIDDTTGVLVACGEN